MFLFKTKFDKIAAKNSLKNKDIQPTNTKLPFFCCFLVEYIVSCESPCIWNLSYSIYESPLSRSQVVASLGKTL